MSARGGGRRRPRREVQASSRGRRADGSASGLRSDAAADVLQQLQPALRLGRAVGLLFVAIGVLLLLLGVLGRGWPYFLGALNFLVVGAVIIWAVRHGWP